MRECRLPASRKTHRVPLPPTRPHARTHTLPSTLTLGLYSALRACSAMAFKSRRVPRLTVATTFCRVGDTPDAPGGSRVPPLAAVWGAGAEVEGSAAADMGGESVGGTGWAGARGAWVARAAGAVDGPGVLGSATVCACVCVCGRGDARTRAVGGEKCRLTEISPKVCLLFTRALLSLLRSLSPPRVMVAALRAAAHLRPLRASPVPRPRAVRAMASSSPAVELWVKGVPATSELLDCEWGREEGGRAPAHAQWRHTDPTYTARGGRGRGWGRCGLQHTASERVFDQ